MRDPAEIEFMCDIPHPRSCLRVPMLLFAILVVLFPIEANARQFGDGRDTAVLLGENITIYTYRPSGCAEPALLFVFHGNGRTASNYRDYARPLADRACLLVFAPLFDRDRFPNWSYHRGGIEDSGDIRPRVSWTVVAVRQLAEWARRRQGRPDAPYYLFGHSAGGQFLSRVAAFEPPSDAQRIVIANPSTHVTASLLEQAPHGFGGVFEEAEAETQLRAYLDLPITIYLGENDTSDEDLHDSKPARRQGEHRLDRGVKVFRVAQSTAAENGWAFGWKLVIAPGTGHSAEDMLETRAVLEAFGFPTIGTFP